MAAALLIVGGLCNWRKIHWTALGSIFVFAAVNAGAGIYVLNHLTDARWAPEGTESLTAPSFAGTPLVGQYLGPLDSALASVMSGVNDFQTFQHALPVALGFLGTSSLALLWSFPMMIVTLVISFFVGRRERSRFRKYRSTVDRLSVELEQVKLQLAELAPAEPVLPAQAAVVDVRMHERPFPA
ncbi:hypothetical protein ASF72_18540 [Arthrobacter sp. Leaf141]|uniref:hypothetical protein n=1 Tax=Arthrobacter sp. Leaf141 TaxID=1736273 RepID=UPI00070233C4|nr:hypothetical protein [Arthrobacter sp. Leaf141]KQQ98441.1 hypothetical protein ASF72_18540 [Arthrobacter sp. Leaf141]